MIDNLCPRCDSKFYTSYPETETRCPFCGFALKSGKDESRSVKRAFIQRDCLLFSGEEVGAGRTVDLSRKGAGVRVMGPMPFKRDDRLRIVIKDFEVDMNARVVWVKGSGGRTTMAGLRFVGPAS
jgi:uncharacterized C2H2 Zn-finger protein